jgi:hypothetical protein
MNMIPMMTIILPTVPNYAPGSPTRTSLVKERLKMLVLPPFPLAFALEPTVISPMGAWSLSAIAVGKTLVVSSVKLMRFWTRMPPLVRRPDGTPMFLIYGLRLGKM